MKSTTDDVLTFQLVFKRPGPLLDAIAVSSLAEQVSANGVGDELEEDDEHDLGEDIEDVVMKTQGGEEQAYEHADDPERDAFGGGVHAVVEVGHSPDADSGDSHEE